MFGKLFLGESKKLIKPKGLIAIGIICVIFFVIYAIFYNIDFNETFEQLQDILENDESLQEELQDALTDEEQALLEGYIGSDFIRLATPENIDAIIAEFTEQRDELVFLNKQKGTRRIYGSEIYYCNGVISLLNYMKENNVYGDIDVKGYVQSFFKAQSAENFTEDYFDFILSILTIYGIVLAAGLFADEYGKGTVKLVMLRPVGRNTLTTAKLLALFAHLVGLLGATSLIAYIYGAIAFDVTSMTKTYVVFNSSGVFVSTVGAMLFAKMFFGMIKMLAASSLSFMIGTVTRKKTLGIIISLLVSLGLVASLFSMFGGERFVYSVNMDLSIYFGLSRTMLSGGNFFIALPMFIVYTAAVFVALYLTVKKRDIV